MNTRHAAAVRAISLMATLAVVAGCSSAEDIAGAGGPGTSPTSAPVTTPSQATRPAPTSSEPTSSGPTSGGPAARPGFGQGPAGDGLRRFYHQHVVWESCDGGNECADIWVPLDYGEPDGQAITVKAERQPAGDPARRQGSMLINPGGPGGSGIDYLGYADFDKVITDVYDVVGFDPRGVARSTPIDCLTDRQLDSYLASDPSPDDPQEVEDFRRTWSAYADGCVERSGPLLSHVSTVEVARDMDIIRAVLGDDKLTYFGASYGTYIGATYAGLFPRKVRRMVLDGAVDPLAKPRASAVAQVGGFEKALTAYLHYCIDEGSCPLGDDVASARQRLIAFLDGLDAEPLSSSSGRQLTEGLAFFGVILPLYDRSSWQYETLALRQALDGDPDTLLLLSDLYTHRSRDGSYEDNSMEALSAVNCLDHPEHESIHDIRSGATDFLRRSPVFGEVGQWWPYACSNWPVKASEPHPDYSAKGAAPIVVVGTTRDPATPYQQAVRLAAELDSGVLLSRDGDGHTAYGAGNSCIDETIDAYLVSGNPPPAGKRC